MEFKSENTGVKVVINPCSFQDAFKLKSAIQKALLKSGVSIEQALDQDLSSLILAIDSDEEIMKCMFECLKKSTYDGIKITMDTFENEEARGDLYDIFFQCLKVNIYPFFKPLLSRFGIELKAPKVGENQK